MPQELAPLELAQINSLEADLRLLDERIAAAEKGLVPRRDGDVNLFRAHRSQLMAQLRRRRRQSPAPMRERLRRAHSALGGGGCSVAELLVIRILRTSH